MQSVITTPAASSGDTAAVIARLVPGDRQLRRAELRAAARVIGAVRSLWVDRVQHDPERRHYVQLYRDLHVDVWLICWSNLQDTGFHDHDVSAGAVHVVEGDLVEDRFEYCRDGFREVSVRRESGAVFDFEASHVHRVRHGGGLPAASIHVYSPALWRMGVYDRDPSGLLRRTSISYAEEIAAA